MSTQLVANGFKFCAHGGEFCHKCFCDNRCFNNAKLEKQIQQEFPRFSMEQLWARPPLYNVLNDAVDSGKKDEEGNSLYQCKSHEAVDCESCFDWSRIVLQNLKAMKDDYGKRIPTEATREAKLQMLASMGIELPSTTGLPEKDVDKKLQSAIDAAQYFSTLVPSRKLDPRSLPLWKGKPLSEVVTRGSFEETRQAAFARRALRQTPFPENEHVFMDLRDTIKALAHGVDEGHKHFLIQDKEQDSVLGLRIVEVRNIEDSDVPVFIVLYARGMRNATSNHVLSWTVDAFRSRKPFAQVTATIEEQNLLLALLNLNAKRLVPQYSPNRGSHEKNFILSYILPVGPVNQQDIGRITRASGCVVCGKKGDVVRECSGCAFVEYCGPACQRADWKEHREICQSLSGGTWHTTTVAVDTEMQRVAASAGRSVYVNHINNRDSLHTAPAPGRPSMNVPVNRHGQRPFLVKMQRPLLNPIGPILMCDRERTFMLFLNYSDDPGSYQKAQKELGSEAKIYRWVKRTGDLELSICFDRKPPKLPAW